MSHSIAEIARGRAPNPDMLCRARAAFGVARERARDAQARGVRPRRDGTTPPSTEARNRPPRESARERRERRERREKTRAPAVKLVMPRTRARIRRISSRTYPSRSSRRCASPWAAYRRLGCARWRARLAFPTPRERLAGHLFPREERSEFVAEHLGERPGAIVELESGDRVGTHAGVLVPHHRPAERARRAAVRGTSAGRTSRGTWCTSRGATTPCDKERRVQGRRVQLDRGRPSPRSPSGARSGSRPGADAGESTRGRRARRRRAGPRGVPSESRRVRAAGESGLFVKVRHGERRYRCTLRFDEEDEGEEGERGGGVLPGRVGNGGDRRERPGPRRGATRGVLSRRGVPGVRGHPRARGRREAQGEGQSAPRRGRGGGGVGGARGGGGPHRSRMRVARRRRKTHISRRGRRRRNVARFRIRRNTGAPPRASTSAAAPSPRRSTRPYGEHPAPARLAGSKKKKKRYTKTGSRGDLSRVRRT